MYLHAQILQKPFTLLDMTDVTSLDNFNIVLKMSAQFCLCRGTTKVTTNHL